MLRRRSRSELLVLSGAIVLLIVIAAVTFRGSSSSPPSPAPSGRPAALAFANSYAGFLDGRSPAAGLPSATTQVKALALSGGTIPAASRAGLLTVRRLRFSGVRGARYATAVMDASDRRHALQAALTLSYADGRWEVSYLVPPDLSTLYAQAAAPPPISPAVRRAASNFTLAYVDYREHATRRLPPGLPFIRRQIAAGQDPLAGLTPTKERARLESIHGLPQGSLTSVEAVASDHGRRIDFQFILERAGGLWEPWQFPVSSP